MIDLLHDEIVSKVKINGYLRETRIQQYEPDYNSTRSGKNNRAGIVETNRKLIRRFELGF